MKKVFVSLVMTFCLLFTGSQEALSLEFPNIKDPNNGIDTQISVIPKAPSNLNYVCTGAGVVTLSWTDNSNNEVRFVIERREDNDSNWFEIDHVGANCTTYEQSQESSYPVFPGETYYYRVKAVSNLRSSAYSSQLMVSVSDSTAPIAPGDVKLVPQFDGGLKVTWTDRSNNEKKFDVERKVAGGQYSVMETLNSNVTEKLFATTFDMTSGSTYYYRVKAYSETGSAYSSEVSITVPTASPSGPVMMYYNVYNSSSSAMTLNWQDKSNNEDGFMILRKKASDPGEFNFYTHLVGVTGKNVTTYVDNNLPPDVVYEYRVGSFNLHGRNWTSTVQAQPTGPQQPTLTATVISNSKVMLNWSCPTTGVDFHLERKITGGQYQYVHDWFFANQNIMQYEDSNLTPGQQYYYRISAARNAGINAVATAEVSVTLPSLLTLPNGSGTGSLSSNGFNNGSTSLGTNVISGKNVMSLNLGKTDFYVNNQVQQMDIAPISKEGRTMLPIRYVTNTLGATLQWDETAQKVTVIHGNKKIELWIGKNTAFVNGQQVMIDTNNTDVIPIVVPPGRTMLPLRFISENLGCQVEWDELKQEVRLIYGN